MEIKFHSTVIMTEEFEQMKSFYQEILQQKIESPRAHSPLLAAGLASKNANSYGIEESSLLAARFFNLILVIVSVLKMDFHCGN